MKKSGEIALISAAAFAVVVSSLRKKGSTMSDFAYYEPQEICDPTEKPGVIAFRNYVLARFGGSDGGIVRACEIGGRSEHKEGRAWDWMTGSGADVDGFFAWLFADDARVIKDTGIMYLIWQHEIWWGRTQGYHSAGWQPYSGSDPHTSHVHLSFSRDGAMGKLPGISKS